MLAKILRRLILILIFEFNACVNSIISGDLAFFGQFPWHVYLEITKSYTVDVYCGGTLISDEWILTSGNCVLNGTQIVAKFGSTRREYAPVQIISTTYLIHPEFTTDLHMDLALVEIAGRLKFFAHIQPALLPPRFITERSLIGEVCSICGFGRFLSNQKQGYQKVLRYEFMRVISNNKCLQVYKNPPKNTICAISVNEQQGPCFGDGGGGLILRKRRKFYVVGVYSYQAANCIGKPSGYQFVRKSVNWITRMTGVQVINY